MLVSDNRLDTGITKPLYIPDPWLLFTFDRLFSCYSFPFGTIQIHLHHTRQTLNQRTQEKSALLFFRLKRG